MISWRILWLGVIFFTHEAFSQELFFRDTSQHKTVVAGEQYGTSSFHQKLWGEHYRKEWTTPVTVPSLILDTAFGGLKPYQPGGGRQTKSLRLRDAQGREYVLRSIDKTFTGALPDIYHNTFVESIANDQVTIAHPYSALTIPVMAEAANIFHSTPIIRWVPQQKALDSFNRVFGNNLYLLEQRADENWETESNFGNAKNIIGTDKVLENVLEDNDDRVDQLSFVRARLFDFVVGDWGRHEDQWRWAQFKEDDDKKIYKPIPRDRDQVYTKFDGFLVSTLLSAAGLDHLRTFEAKIKDINSFNFPARYLDHRFLNELSLEQWISVTKELQQALTNEVIETAINQLPKEVFPISGNELIAKLKSRRDHLEDYATKYYKFLAEEVDLAGTKKNEFFDIKRIDDEQTSVSIYKITKEGKTKSTPFYSRIFKNDETKELRIYGIAGNDKYNIDGKVNDAIKVRIIGGVEKDSIANYSTTQGKRTFIYDNPGNAITEGDDTKIKLSEDTTINRYRYDAFQHDKKGIKAAIFYNRADKLYLGIGYGWQHQKWRKTPFAHQHSISARYSIPQNAFNFLYKGRVSQFIGKWDLDLHANYDFRLWTNFYGIGNETEKTTEDIEYYRTHSKEGYVSAALMRSIGRISSIEVRGFYQRVEIINIPDQFVAKTFASDKTLYDKKNFGGGYINFIIQKLNGLIIPTKGIGFSTTVSYAQNLAASNRNVTRYEGQFDFYVPILRHFVLAVRTGGATLTGTPEFYQYNSIGGADNLRGYRRDRFWGKTTFFDANELQYLFNFRSRVFNGKMGLYGLFDTGRVWQPDEDSDKWYTALGGGFMVAPFNRLLFSISYAVASEGGNFHIRFVRPI
jgi:hypothetical protein